MTSTEKRPRILDRCTARRLVLRVLEELGPCTDAVLEGAMWGRFRIKYSTTRGARKAGERAGLVCYAGRAADGRKSWDLVGVDRSGRQQLHQRRPMETIMKREGLRHPKHGRLCKLLGIEPALSVGILESLWHFTAARAPAGNVGRWSDEEIADEIRCGIPAVKLIPALVNAGWLDEHPDPTLRLVVHDWSQHSEDSVHMQLARSGKLFADGTRPKLTRLSKSERAAAEAALADAERTPCTQQTHAVHTTNALPCPAKPGPARPSPAMPKPRPTGARNGSHDAARNGHSEPNGTAMLPPSRRAGVFTKLGKEDLADDARLDAWYRDAVSRRKPVIRDSEANRLRVFGAAERALEEGDKPPALFAKIVSGEKWDLITQAQEQRAVDRLKRFDGHQRPRTAAARGSSDDEAEQHERRHRQLAALETSQ